MFHQDTVGRLLIDQLIKAADRGVRVCMLIDDIYDSDADDVWTALDAQPDIHHCINNLQKEEKSWASIFYVVS